MPHGRAAREPKDAELLPSRQPSLVSLIGRDRRPSTSAGRTSPCVDTCASRHQPWQPNTTHPQAALTPTHNAHTARTHATPGAGAGCTHTHSQRTHRTHPCHTRGRRWHTHSTTRTMHATAVVGGGGGGGGRVNESATTAGWVTGNRERAPREGRQAYIRFHSSSRRRGTRTQAARRTTEDPVRGRREDNWQLVPHLGKGRA